MSGTDTDKKPIGGILERVDLKDRVPRSWKHKYRYLKLENGLQVMLASNADAEDCGASMRANCGYFNDPKEIPGVAHFCEHMLFLGTTKYPGESDYSEYLSANGGRENAATGSESTYYYFTVNPSGFEGALDRFAQFFISPLFTESGTERELNAIESEHMKNFSSDGRRSNSVLRSICIPDHPFSKFGTGNKETLTSVPVSELRAALLKFFNKFYTPKNMFLALECALSLDEMENLVTKYFSAIPQRDGYDGHGGPAPIVKGTPVLPFAVDPNGVSRCLLKWLPLDDSQSLRMEWGYPGGPRDRWRTAPFQYISHLIGHESKGSILALLKDLGWATALTSGRDFSQRSFEVFGCTIQLTEEGFKQWESVASIVYAYIGMLRKIEPSLTHFEELKITSDLKYEYMSRDSTVDDVNLMTDFLSNGNELDTFFTSEYLLFDFDPVEIKTVLDCLSPNKTVTSLSSPSFVDICTETEKWYGAKYSFIPSVPDSLQQTWLAAFNHDFSNPQLTKLPLDKLVMPELNPFIPTPEGCKILAEQNEEVDKTTPERIYDDEQSTCFWKQDRTFRVPRVIGHILLANNRVRGSMHDHCCAFLFKEIFSHYINDFNYMASMADTDGALTTNSRGFVIKVSGYNEKIGAYMKLFLENFRDFVPPEPLFNMIKARLLEVAKNSLNDPAFRAVLDVGNFYGVSHGQFSMMVLYDEWEKITLRDLIEWQDAYRKTGVRILSFFQGNLTKDSAVELTKMASSILSLPVVSPENMIQNDSCQIPVGLTQFDLPRFGEDKNNAVLFTINTGLHKGEYNEDCVYLNLLQYVVKPHFYDEMRTKQQLGYVVFTIASESLFVDTWQFLIQSNTQDPDYVTDRINEFRATIPALVDKVTDEDFQGLVKSFITTYSIKDTTMVSNARSNWGSLITGDLHFRSDEELVALAKKCTRDGLVAFTKKYFSPDTPEKREFWVRIWGRFQNQADADAAGKKVVLSDPKTVLKTNSFKVYCHNRHKVFEKEL